MDYQLFYSAKALEFLRTLKKADQRRIYQRCEEIQAFPSRHSDHRMLSESGGFHDVNICGRYSIRYWDDFADRHLKIISISLAG